MKTFINITELNMSIKDAFFSFIIPFTDATEAGGGGMIVTYPFSIKYICVKIRLIFFF